MTVPFSARSTWCVIAVGVGKTQTASLQRGRRHRRRRGRSASPVMILASFCKNHRAFRRKLSAERNYRLDRYIVAPLLSLRVLLRFRFDFCHNRFRSIHNDLIQFPLHRIEVKNASQKPHHVIIGKNVWRFKE